MSIAERIQDNVTVTPTGCWEWTLSTNQYGYGQMKSKGRNFLAHRVAYEQFVGPIPVGLTLDHLCRNRRCVNPSHLEPVTNGENVLRGTGPTAVNAAKTECINGHPFDESNTYVYGGKSGTARGCKECRREAVRRMRARG